MPVSTSYQSSTILPFLQLRKEQRLPLRLAVLDIDNTFSGDRTLVNQTRKRLEDNGYAIIFASTRSEELIMSKAAFNTSVEEHGFARSQPHSGIVDAKSVYANPVTIVPEAHLDPEIIIGSTGTQVYVKQPDGGYREDKEYTESFGMTSEKFRAEMLRLIHDTDPEKTLASLATVDDPLAYSEKRIDIAVPLFRVQVMFKDLEAKLAFFSRLSLPTNIKYVDESYPQQSRIKGHFMPAAAGKSHAVNHVMKILTKSLSVPLHSFIILLAGDAFPDLIMASHAAVGTQTTVLIAGGSRLTDIFTGAMEDFAGESITEIKQEFEITQTKGIFKRASDSRPLLVGDLVYPGTIAIETIAAYVAQIPNN